MGNFIKGDIDMSYWTYVNGTITVNVPGRTQPEIRYILETVIAHLPKVTGSEGNMDVYLIQKNGHNFSSTHNEFGIWQKDWEQMQTKYIIVLDGSLRDRMFSQTFKELNIFLNRLSKRLQVDDILVSLKSHDPYEKEYLFRDSEKYGNMCERPSWVNDSGEPAWWEYLMWNQGIDTELPMALEYKYVNNPENDKEWERRKEMK